MSGGPEGPVAYMMSRFPTVTETFVLFEMLALERIGTEILVFPLVRERGPVVHPEALAMMPRVRHAAPYSPAAARAVAFWLRRRPRRYAGTWWRVVRGNARSPRFLIRAVAATLQAGAYAREMDAAGVRRVHAHFATHPALAAYVVHRLTDVPYSFTAHAHDIYVNRTMLDEKIADASFVVTISRFNKEFLASRYGPEADAKVSVIHCGVDLDAFPLRDPRPQGEVVTILCVASMKEYKGHRFLVEACAQLRERGLPFRCLLVGDGDERAEIEAHIARRGLGGHVELLGALPRDEVSTLMAEADVFVLASITTESGKMEGIPVALMEALATGIPAVATRISGISELIRHEQTGLLVEERDPSALADAVERLHGDPELRARVVTQGRELVAREFDLDRNAEALQRLLA